MLRRLLIPFALAVCFVALPMTARPPCAWADTPAGSGSAAIPPPPVDTATPAPTPTVAPTPPVASTAPVVHEPSEVVALWKSGALTPAIILGLFIGLMWLSRHVTWLQKGSQAALIASLLSGCAVLVERAAAGTTPTLGMILSAVGASALLFMNPKKPPTTPPV